ncbi:hypothetical protein AB0I68_10000 [Streptomyces sp. NPDC050448]|uniref:hypothetical protein n=1 Tax=Streptomyces sp. NPDC050448 TaxID=3155404 RepID=UPI00342D1F98
MAIAWGPITQPRLDRIVEALVHRLYAEDAEVEVMNGRGGDGGIDIKVTADGRVWIYQLKYFPNGFPGSYEGRGAGIKRSFRRRWSTILTTGCWSSPVCSRRRRGLDP